MKTKKKSYKQLEKHIQNTKILLMKVTRKMAAQTTANENLKGLLTVANAYIGYLAKDSVEIDKEKLTEFMYTKAVTWKEEDTKIIINVIEKEIAKESETVVN